MDEARPDMGILGGRHVQHIVHHAVAHVGARSIGDVAGQAVIPNVLHHGLDGEGGQDIGEAMGTTH